VTRQAKIDKALDKYKLALCAWKTPMHRIRKIMRQESIAAHEELQNVLLGATDDPEPQADDVETIRALDAIAKAKQKLSDLCSGKERWHMSIPADEHNDPDIVIMDGLHLAEAALSRLSAPVDVQAKAWAVVQEFAKIFQLSVVEDNELSRLIVEQFSTKG